MSSQLCGRIQNLQLTDSEKYQLMICATLKIWHLLSIIVDWLHGRAGIAGDTAALNAPSSNLLQPDGSLYCFV
jgi:hypothetical protein